MAKAHPRVWAPFGTGLPAVPAYDLSLNPQRTKLVLASHGRGVYVMAVKYGKAPTSTSSGGGTGKGSNGSGSLAGTGLAAGVPLSALLLLVTGLALHRRRARG
jgi:hypothetical protein